MRSQLQLYTLCLAACASSPTEPAPEATAGHDESANDTSEPAPTQTPTHARWTISSRYRLEGETEWSVAETVQSNSPIESESSVSQGQAIGEMGRHVGCDLSFHGTQASIACTALETRTSAAMEVRCLGETSVERERSFNFTTERGEVEITMHCELITLED